MDIYNAGHRVMNTYIYDTQEGYVMVDAGYKHSLGNVEKKSRKQRIALSKIKYVFLTYAHDDHAGFMNELLLKYPDIKVIISDKAMPVLLRGQNSLAGGCSGLTAFVFCKFMGLIGKGNHLFTPGHTSDSISLKFGNIIFCGDAAMNGVPSLKRITIWIEDKNAERISSSPLEDNI